MPALRCLSYSAVAAGLLLAGCASAGSSAAARNSPSASSAGAPAPAAATGAASATPSRRVAPPGIVAVTKGGALIRLNPVTGKSTGSTTALPAIPPAQDSGLPSPISHLSWSADSTHLAVSTAAVQDNEGWGVTLVDVATARYYRSGTGVTDVPVTGSPTPRQSYLREGVYPADGGLDVSADGKWLLYLAGGTLYLSPGGARPHALVGGLTAAAWS